MLAALSQERLDAICRRVRRQVTLESPRTVCIRDVLLVVKGVLYLVDLWSVETGLEYDESDVPKDTR